MSFLRHIGVHSAAKLFGITYALMGLFFGFFTSLAALISASTGQTTGILGLIFGVGSIVFLPVAYGVIGYIGTAIFIALFNLVADYTGGIELEFETPGSFSQFPQGEPESSSRRSGIFP